uniref:Serine/threonine-protein kinase ATG1 n=1 Tax=Blastobotrys adeninivorans TaxID=409370 RepID=A0A060T0R2_BLAAD
MDLKIGAEIGRGSFATVYKGEYKGSAVAVKSVLRAKLNKKLLENLESEISILKDMNKHPHIVALLDYQQTKSHFHLIMEYCSLGDLSYFIHKRKDISNCLPLVASLFQRYPSPHSGLHEELARHFLQQLSSALAFLRSKNLVHRDIKPQNLLLCPPAKSKEQALEYGYTAGLWELPVLKLADFGFARILPSTSLAETLCGSPLYMAPEILRYEKYGAKADLWSVGAVLYEMIVGKPPFKAANHVELLSRIEKTNDHVTFPEIVVAHTSADIRQLVKGLLKKSPTQRISYAEFFDSPVVRNSVSDNNNDTPLDRSKLDDKLFISEYVRFPDNSGTNSVSPTTSSVHDRNRATVTTTVPSPPDSNSESSGNGSHTRQTTTSESGGSGGGGSTRRLNQEDDYVVVEKRTVQVNALADEFAHSPTNAMTRRRTSSPSRRNSVAYGSSPTSALAKALNMASARLFKVRLDPFGGGIRNPLPSPAPQQSLIPAGIDADEKKLIKELDLLATKAKVINLFAEVKFSQVLPDDDNIDLSPDTFLLVSEEALVLYLKVLSLYAKAMDRAAQWWSANEERGACPRLNDTVQWIRDRFNECLEKAEYCQSLNERYASSRQIQSSSSSSPISAEKLIFDRALEMSRAAAVCELDEKDLEGCEVSYGTAVWMLEALLESPVDDTDPLDMEDRKLVEKFITSIGDRLNGLRQKIEKTKESV